MGSENPGIRGALAASAINALWAADKIFIMILTDKIYGKGPGGACGAYFAKQGVCLDGVLHLVLRWRWSQTKAAVTPGYFANPSELDSDQWAAWGAYPVGTGTKGAKNDDHLAEFDLSLEIVVKSAVKTQKEHGFLFKNQNGETIKQLTANPTDLKPQDLMFFSIPVCDLPAIMGPGKAFSWDTIGDGTTGENPILKWGGCTCIIADGWPIKDWDLTGGLPASQCKNKGWVDAK